MSEELNQNIAISSVNCESEEARFCAAEGIKQVQSTDLEGTKKTVEEETADTNTPASITAEVIAASATEAISTPCTDKPVTSEQGSCAVPANEPVEKTSVINVDTEPPTEFDTECAALESPDVASKPVGEIVYSEDVLLETCGETLISDGAVQKAVVSEEQSAEAFEDLLEDIPMNTEESPPTNEGKDLPVELEQRSDSMLEQSLDSTPVQTDGLPSLEQDIQMDADIVDILPQTESIKCSLEESGNKNLLKDTADISKEHTTCELEEKDSKELEKDDVAHETHEEVVTLDLCNEDIVVEKELDKSLNKIQEIEGLTDIKSKSEQHEEIAEILPEELEKEPENSQNVEIAKEALNKKENENISVVKEDASGEQMPVPVSTIADMEVTEDTKAEADNKALPKEQSECVEATDGVPEESLETMDTCDSQESTLVIDEMSDVTDNKDKNETESKESNDEPMDTGVESSRPNREENINDNIPKEVRENKTDKTIENTKKKLNETHPADESKDDDVIPIEQPPMPIIEIDDDDDEDEIANNKIPTKDNEPIKATSMDIDGGQPQEKSNDKPSAPMEISSKETEISGNDLLTVATEKTMDEVAKEEESKTKNADSEDTTDEVFYNKECINYECSHKHKQFLRVPQFAFSYFKVNKKKFKMQYICADCYDKALDMFEEYCGLINAKQPLLMENIPSGRQEFVEIIDSSDEEDGPDSSKVAEPTGSDFSKNDLSLIEQKLYATIKSVFERVEIQNQLTWSKTILSERLKHLEMETEFVDMKLRSLQRKADKMHEGLYSCPKIKIRQLQPLDLNSGKIMGFESHQQEVQPIPPVGEIERPAIQTNGTYFAVKNNAIASWVPCKVVDQVEGGLTAQKNVKYYRVRFLKSQHQMLKTVPAKYMSYYEPPTVRLPIGTRVIAYFDATSLARGREKMNVQSAFYPGIIAEPLKPNNKFRYLIFYDDGYTQYVYHKDVRLVCHVSENVWEDVHPASRDFIQKYLTQYSINRPMVQTQKGQSMNTESNGYWLHARVVDIDCSLVLMQFEGSKSHTEWIYRGSLRLGPVFKEYQKTLQKNTNVPVSRLPRRTEPFIRYTEDEESTSQQQQAEKSNEGNRAVARKSFGRPESMMNTGQSASNAQRDQSANLPPVKHLNNSTIYVEDENKPKGKVVYYTAKRNLPPRKYTPHVCSPGCLFEITHNLSAYSPLSKPLLSGWERFIIRQKIKKVVTYRAPCGKIFRNMKELHHYLRVTKNLLNVDNFDFSPDTNCLAEYVIESAIIQKRDISCGQEKMAIPLVNYYDNTLPPECKYSAKVIPTEGVNINKDPEFFAGCDCDDDCSDKSKCGCWQLTVAGAKYGNPNTSIEEVGYQYKRLLEHVPTGIYECNPRCKCKQNCLNRVVQHSLQLKLQVFKTSNRGWGLRCINDVPRGTFVCVYAGHLLTEAKANEGGQDAGDEYFAELDYIEVAEQIKEGYESEVEPPEPDDEDTYQPELDDDDFTPSKSFLTRSKRQSATKSTRNQEDDSQERQVINFNPNADMNEDSVRESSIRKLYGRDEACYVMDAKISGNLGRYFNHSCAPNMFVQNVFVDTHDLRFPWVAFFASCNIRAGTELTWNYNYEVGVVPGKVLYCQCGAPTCRLRLL